MLRRTRKKPDLRFKRNEIQKKPLRLRLEAIPGFICGYTLHSTNSASGKVARQMVCENEDVVGKQYEGSCGC